MTVPAGPFESEHEARSAAHSVIPPAEGSTILTSAQNRQLIGDALGEAGVRTGAYDDQILKWLSGWEDAICAVVAGLVSRAHAAGMAAREDGKR
jgi:hypothetical protein